jgi:SAM-dependent methyltransferase
MPVLTEQQQQIRAEFLKIWLQTYPEKYSVMENFNHQALFKDHVLPKNCMTLEIGAGIGTHIKYEDVIDQRYHALELREDFVEQIKKDFPQVTPICGDIQKKISCPEHSFDRIIAVHVLEHLPDLPAALREIKRLLKPSGFCEFVLPCEGGLAYSLARKISAQRLFEKRYPGTPYDLFIKSEHVNTCREIIEELNAADFYSERKAFFPFPLPFIFCNLAVGLRCRLLSPKDTQHKSHEFDNNNFKKDEIHV